MTDLAISLGNFSLHLAFFFAVFAVIAAIAGAIREETLWVRRSERAVHVIFVLLSLSMIGLEVALLADRFDIAFVAQNSSLEQPWGFKVAALWAGQDGSLLLWAWMLSLLSSLVVLQNRHRHRSLMPWVIVVLMSNVIFFAGVAGFESNPFAPQPGGEVASDGHGMNPLLQHLVMLIHPPVLYVGFVGFVVPFAFALAALITGELGQSWFRTTRRWTLTAWFFLGTGIILGARWAYDVLGWGGYWGWDPVENASFMPWLAGTAYLHSVMIQEKRGMLKIWNLALIGLTYSLCLFGTFLTRSGIVQSVHSFSNAGWFGLVFLGYVVLVAGVFSFFLILRVPMLRSENRLDSVLSREASFLLNNWAFLGLLSIVFFGTLYPVFSQALWGTRVQIGPPFFERYAGPLALFTLLLTGVGPLIAWRRATWVNLRKSFLWPGVIAGLSGVALLVAGVQGLYPLAYGVLCTFVAVTIVGEYGRGIRARMRRGEGPVLAVLELIRRNQRRYGGYIVHLGVVLMFIGFAGAPFNLEETKLLKPGETWALDGYVLEYRQARPVEHAHYAGAVARVALHHQGEPVGILMPEKRMYFQQEQPTTIPAVLSSLSQDVYLILVGLEPDRSAAFKVFINPLVNWIWLGSVVFVLGNLLVLWPVPERRKGGPA